ncbi:hypothetical protein [Winogradskyella helgolandensis]|uniref:hypothetical protein n=1 Tax=Winogradskyella helgolandensis TaxID=2697010 RepID=UPI0015CCDD61|nr:hypothetical protein [Winogradskyella helgolandensis]
MKKIIIALVVTLFISVSSFAQQGINYKALIKDDNGNTLINTNIIDVQFTIYEGAALINQVYQETHTNASTDANGILISTIGDGNTSDVFSDISWGNDEHWLNIQIDIGDGLVDVSTTQFMAVPYALSAANVSGLEKITESVSPDTGLPYYGWRLIGQNPDSYGNIGVNAVDLSQHTIVSDSWGATGKYAFTTGGNTRASESYSTAMGYATHASGSLSTAIGYFTIAEARNSTAIGKWNVGGGDPLMDIPTDPMFEIGIGTNLLRENALTVLKNGTITAPSFDISEITDDKALITKEYADSNLIGSGLEQIIEGGNTGWRLVGRNPDHYGNIGDNAVDLSYTGFTSFYGATGDFSTAIGNRTFSSGDYSTALGYATVSSGDYSTAIGSSNSALGDYSIALGSVNNASGDYSTAMGRLNSASSYGETVIGLYSTESTPNNISNWDANDRLFVIGNGFYDGGYLRSNALVVLKNGTITAPSFDISEITDDKALITKEFADSNYINSTSNLVPIAYGTVESNANVLSGTGNFSATISSGVIKITVDNENLTVFNSACTIVPYGGNPRFSTLTYLNNKLEVRVFNSSGSLTPTTFQFVLYKL